MEMLNKAFKALWAFLCGSGTFLKALQTCSMSRMYGIISNSDLFLISCISLWCHVFLLFVRHSTINLFNSFSLVPSCLSQAGFASLDWNRFAQNHLDPRSRPSERKLTLGHCLFPYAHLFGPDQTTPCLSNLAGTQQPIGQGAGAL